MSSDFNGIDFNSAAPLPNGDYIAVITDCHEDDRGRICVGLSVKAPSIYAGRLHTDKISVREPLASPDAVAIGKRRLQGLLTATGIDPAVGKFSDLHGHHVRVKIVNRLRGDVNFTNVESYCQAPELQKPWSR
jgi:hypothetical protein